MRHAEPVTYGYSTSGLNREGLSQIVLVAKKFVQELTDDKEHILKVIYSSRKRTRQSAINLNQEIIKIIEKNNITNIKITKPEMKKILQTADPINGIVELGYPLEDALIEWVKMPEQDLKKLGIKTPNEIIDSFLENFRKENEASDIIAVTHETTLMAFQKKYFPKLKSRPRYTEIMEIFLDKESNSLVLKYQGKEININDT